MRCFLSYYKDRTRGHDFTIVQDMDAFVIDFTYQGAAYTGLVSPKEIEGKTGYSVRLESENQEFFLDIFAKPCGEDHQEWCFMDESERQSADSEFLQEIGEAIEEHLSA
jgi:hypothetical protein